MDILRFITAGSVDDGKSTLTGRLLHDSKSILADQLETIRQQSKNVEEGEIDLALLTDGLRAEREQGITIDVAYKYFATPSRKFIIIDSPGHIQYTRNMITGASNADLVIILIDACNGIVEQTKRHSIIASLLDIKHVIVAINKMDLVNFSQEVFDNIVTEYEKVAESIELKDVRYIPISAKDGDNVVNRSRNISWYKGEALLSVLEKVEIQNDINLANARFPVQYIIRPQSDELHDYRGFAGKVTSGIYKVGDKVKVLPSGVESTISAIEVNAVKAYEAFAQQSAVFQLATDVDVSRGNVIVKADDALQGENELEALVCWLGDEPLSIGNRYLLQLNSQLVKGVVKGIQYKIDVNTLLKNNSVTGAHLNDVVKVTIKTAAPIVFDSYKKLRNSGNGILIDETSNSTVGALLIQ